MRKLASIITATVLWTAARAGVPVPPAEHPRLYLRSGDIPELRERMETRDGKNILRRMKKLSVPRTPEEEAAETDRGFRYYFKMRGKPIGIQLMALDYLTNGDAEKADRAIAEMLDTLKRTNFGTQKDLSRASGVMLMTGAIVYDWCYDRMSSETRAEYIKEFIRISGTMECGYPPRREEPIAGHISEWMVLRDMLSAGIAVYDEYPDMYNHVMSMITEDYAPVRDYFYSGHNYHQGSSYINVRFSNDMIAQWILTRMGAEPPFSREQQYVLYDDIYRRRPDGHLLPAGDVNPGRRGAQVVHTLPMMLASSYYKDPYLAYEYGRKPSMDPHCLILELLWRDFNLRGKAPDDLPLQRFCGSPYGWMIARTGWDASSVIVEMKVNEQFVGNHQHLDGGSFQIYYKGPLAIDSGTYQGSSGGYNSPHCKNYFKRTVAHNSLLIYDPEEKFECWNYGGADKTVHAANDGGQRLPGDRWETCHTYKDLTSEAFTYGKTLSHYTSADFSCLKGDITKAYTSKVKDARRSFAFMDLHGSDIPAVLVVFDHIVSSDPTFRKTFLLHSIEEPGIDGSNYIVRRTMNGDSGMLYCDCLLPKNACITKIGGPGKEFWVDGVNYPNERKDEANERGAWRIEINPSQPQAEDCFLNVIQIGDNECKTFRSASLIEAGAFVGACVENRAVLFSRNGDLFEGKAGFTIPNGPVGKILVTDVAAGKWKVTKHGKKTAHTEVKAGENVIVIDGGRGKYTIEKE